MLKIGRNNTKPQHNYSGEKEKEKKQERQVAKIQTEQPPGYRINPFISGSTTNNCQFCSILAPQWKGQAEIAGKQPLAFP